MEISSRIIPNETDTVCPIITGWILGLPCSGKKPTGLKAIGIFQSTMFMDVQMHTLSIFSRTRKILRKGRLYNYPFSGSCLLLPIISDFKRRTIMIIKAKIRYKDSLEIVFSFLTIFIFSGCQKVINVDLNEAAPRIVIEGLITDIPGPYTVKISKSGSYFNQPVLPPVSDAQVIITDNISSTDTLKETEPGIYITSKIRGFPGRTYSLKVLSENIE